MNAKQIARYIDHTALSAEKTDADILKLCDEAIAHHFFSVCINSCHIPLAKQKLAGSGVKICTVVGFPLGANLTSVKAFETQEAIAAGADEIDMVINVGWVKSAKWQAVQDDISQRDIARFGGWRAVEAVRKGGAGLLARAAEKLGGFAFADGRHWPALAGALAAPAAGFAGGAAVHIGGDTVTINVHAAPGMSEAGLVEKIKRVLNERDAARRRRANSSYYDKD